MKTFIVVFADHVEIVEDENIARLVYMNDDIKWDDVLAIFEK